jgi:hypothetical protein
MQLRTTILVGSLSVALAGCTSTGGVGSDVGPGRATSPSIAVEVAKPLVPLARMMPGAWRTTAPTGTSMYDSWHWGPGRHSMRAMTVGTSSVGDPWRAMEVVYWHPRRAQLCRFGISPYARGVMEGTIAFEGETAESVVDMHQTTGLRKLMSRWTFGGADMYHDELLESAGAAGYEPLAAWDRVRVASGVDDVPSPQEPSAYLKALRPLLSRTWRTSEEANQAGDTGERWDLLTTVEYVPYADGVYVRVAAPREGGEPAHVLDAYLYHHTGAGELRCLALSREGGVYEGAVTVGEGGALQFDIKGYEGPRAVQLVGRLDLEGSETARHRLWSIGEGERTLIHDVRHQQVVPVKTGLPTGKP